MTYFGFLLRFLFIPIGLMLLWTWWDARRGRQVGAMWRGWPAWSALLIHMVIAVVYTTPWDNYLVATGVWWYDPQLVTGLVLGWVPIEEYTFFVVQPILAGLWLLALMRYWRVEERRSGGAGEQGEFRPSLFALRMAAVGGTAVIWLIMLGILLTGWKSGTYLALEMGWALPPIMLQLGFGADILWRQRWVVLGTIVPMTLYLSAADALAIKWGTWTIDPEQSLNFLLGGVLPLEEFVFFLLTNVLLTFGVTLLLSVESHERIAAFLARWRGLESAAAKESAESALKTR